MRIMSGLPPFTSVSLTSLDRRVASLTSAILPVVALAVSLFLNYFSTKYIESRVTSTIITELRPLEQLPDEWWYDVNTPTPFDPWSQDEKVAFMSLPKESRNWKQPPSIQVINQAKASEEWDNCSTAYAHFIVFQHLLYIPLVLTWQDARAGKDTHFGEALSRFPEYLSPQEVMEGPVSEFWRDYEAYLRHEMAIPATAVPQESCAEHMLRA